MYDGVSTRWLLPWYREVYQHVVRKLTLYYEMASERSRVLKLDRIREKRNHPSLLSDVQITSIVINELCVGRDD